MAQKQKSKTRIRRKAKAGAAGPGRNRPARPPADSLWLYGRHAVAAALSNTERPLRRVLATQSALDFLSGTPAPKALLSKISPVAPHEIDAALPAGAVHQGLAAEVDDLPRARLRDVCADPAPGDLVAVLDQITDPHNIGAVIRSAAAFGARAVIVQDRRTPPADGALAKAAAGALEIVPLIRVVNIARALEGLQGLGWHCAGLAGAASDAMSDLPADNAAAIVLGAEGAGLRQLVATTCDRLYHIPIAAGVESLNVSNAAAIAFYETARRQNQAAKL